MSNADYNIRKCQIIWTVLIAGSIGLLVFLAVLIPSFKYVEYNEYAFRHYTYSHVDLSRVYTQGRYIMSPIYQMVKLPSTYQIIDIIDTVFSNLGLEFNLHVVVYYQLPRGNLSGIYRQFSLNYGNRIINIVKTTVKDTATAQDFSIDDYVQNRAKVESTFSTAIHNALINTIGVDIPGSIRLLDITLPDSVVNSSLTSAIELQNNQIQLLQQHVAVIQSDTLRLVTNISLETNLTLATANIEAGNIVQNSLSEANGIITAARGNGIEAVLEVLNITTPSLRDEFVRLVAILDSNQAKVLSGTFTPLVTV